MNLLGIYYKWLLPTRAELLLEHLRGNIIWSTNGCAHLLRITAASCQSLTHKVEVPKPFSWLSKLFLLPVPLRGVTGFWLAIGTEWQHVNVVWSQTPYSKSDWAAKAQRKLMDGSKPRSGRKSSATILPKESKRSLLHIANLSHNGSWVFFRVFSVFPHLQSTHGFLLQNFQAFQWVSDSIFWNLWNWNLPGAFQGTKVNEFHRRLIHSFAVREKDVILWFPQIT